MMSREPQPSSTAENSRFSMTAVTAIHQRREKAVTREGAISGRGREAARTPPASWTGREGGRRSLRNTTRQLDMADGMQIFRNDARKLHR